MIVIWSHFVLKAAFGKIWKLFDFRESVCVGLWRVGSYRSWGMGATCHQLYRKSRGSVQTSGCLMCCTRFHNRETDCKYSEFQHPCTMAPHPICSTSLILDYSPFAFSTPGTLNYNSFFIVSITFYL